MPQDLFTLKKTAEKLNEEVKNAVINKVVQPSENEFCLTLYNGKQFALVFSANGNLSRVAISYKIHKAPLVAPNFCMLLRKHLLGGRIKSVSIACDDRILAFEIENENEFKISKTYFLYAEIMNKFSNVFLTYDGVILGSLKNAPQNLDSKRIILRGAKYVFPEKLNKKRAFCKEELHEVFANYNGENLEKFLLDNFVDFSPISAREISYICKNYSLSPAVAVEKFLLKPLCPTIIKTDHICDFFAFDYEHLKGERVYYNDFLTAQCEYFENLENEQKNNAYKSYLSSKISAYEKRYLKKLLAVEKSENDFLGADKFRLYGELLTANLFRLKKGQKSVFIENYYQ